MTSSNHNEHHKHTKLARPVAGIFGRNELAILGTTCTNIERLATTIIDQLSNTWNIAFVDAEHNNNGSIHNPKLQAGASTCLTTKGNVTSIEIAGELKSYKQNQLLNEQDLILINGNHFNGKSQVVVIDPLKPLEKKIEKLNDVKLILLIESSNEIPSYIQKLPGFENIPVLHLSEERLIGNFITNHLNNSIAPLNGLVLAGGESRRMQSDKSSLTYHEYNQREHLYKMLSELCSRTFISCNAVQAASFENTLPIVEDSFLNLGPFGGILSAFQKNPNVAWLTVACDLPFLSKETIEYLIENRNPSKIATAYYDAEGKFPEPLVTIWEPKSYHVLLHFLSQGYSCPRKVLINSDVEMLVTRNTREFRNVNTPEDKMEVLQELKEVVKPNASIG